MSPPIRHSFTRFTPAETERITGLSADMQRTWRKRGFLTPRSREHTGFDALELASIRIRARLTQLGTPPREHQAIADKLSRIVLWYALMDVGKTCEVRGLEPDVLAFRKAWDDNEDLISYIVGIGLSEVQQFWIALDDSPASLQTDLTALLQQRENQGEVGLFIDLMRVGQHLGLKAERPLIIVEIDPSRPITENDVHETSVRLPKARRSVAATPQTA